MFFCKLERDEKTFLYFKKYIQELSVKDSVKIDNEIQIEELKKHCKRKGVLDSNMEEVTSWIKNNAKGLRNYLNTIKLVYLVWYCMGHDWDRITWEEFCRIENDMNSCKENILDKIR